MLHARYVLTYFCTNCDLNADFYSKHESDLSSVMPNRFPSKIYIRIGFRSGIGMQILIINGTRMYIEIKTSKIRLIYLESTKESESKLDFKFLHIPIRSRKEFPNQVRNHRFTCARGKLDSEFDFRSKF